MKTITLRAMEPTDVDAVYALETAADVERASLHNAPLSRHQLVNYAFSYSANMFADGQLRLIIEADGAFAGTVDVTDIDAANGHAMVGVAVLEPLRRQGIALEALRKVCDMCRSVGLHQLVAIVARDNAPSLALFAAAGFKTSGCLRSWLRRGPSYADALLLQRFV